MPQFDRVIVADTHQIPALLLILYAGNEFHMGRNGFQLVLAADVEDSHQIVLARHCKFEAIRFEITAKYGIGLLDFVYPLACPQIPYHSESPEISREVQRLVRVETPRMDFLLVALLHQNFRQSSSVPQRPALVIRTREKVSSSLHIRDAIDSVGVPLLHYCLLLLQLPHERPCRDLSVCCSRNDIGGSTWDGADTWVDGESAYLGAGLKGRYLRAEICCARVGGVPDPALAAGADSHEQISLG